LGWNVKKYGTRKGTKLLIKPSDDSVKRIKEKLRKEWKASVGKRPLSDSISILNRVIRGWANYHRHIVASRTFSELDYWMFQREQRYTSRKHKDKSWGWRKERYWGKMDQNRNDQWVFGDKQTKQFIWKFSWTNVQRHTMVKGTESPDDPNLKTYWQNRTKVKTKNLFSKKWREIAKRQNGRCLRCGDDLDNEEEIQLHHIDPERGDDVDNLEIVHLYCHQQISARQATERAHKRRQAVRRQQ
jgi:RNA-directed DNA polymerase